MLRFHTLGALDLRAADGRVLLSVLAQPKRTALLAYLAIASPRGCHRRDTVLGLFWPESEMERARHSLNQAVYALRCSLGEGAVVSRGNEEIGLDPGQLWCDVIAFEEALTDGKIAEALELYRGDLLPGFFLSDALEFERWLEIGRTRLRDRAAEAAWLLAQREEEAGNGAGAAHWARRAAALVPDDELALRRLITLLDRVGDRAGALAAYEAFSCRLAEEYGGEPSPDTRALIEEVRSVESPLPPIHSPAIAPPATGAPARRDHPPAERSQLPAQPTPFVGREAELEEVRRLLEDRACRLVTLVGPGGIGKTRLALQAAAEGMPSFRDGVRFVPLAPVTSPDLLVSALAKALELSFGEGAEPSEQLLDHLADREMLLALDNFDHLVESAGFVTGILEHAPRVKLLVTSRQALNVRGEWLFPLQGLSFPREPTSTDLEKYSAVQLFLQTAQRSGESLALSGKDGPCVLRICRLVDGLPLAIELAAAWVRALSCEEICREIERNYRFLAASLRDVPERHRSLWAAFEYSWNHLSDEEREVFRGFTVFRGGFEREAAETVAGASLQVLSGLIDRSLLRRTPSGRYEMLEVLRQFAEEHLDRGGEAVRDRHCEYYADLVRGREDDLAGANQDKALAEMGREIENLRAAWRWAVERRKVAQIESCLESLFIFYDVRGWHQEAEEAFGLAARALEGGDGELNERTATTLVRLLARQGVFCLRLGLYEKARELLERSLPIARKLGDRGELAFTLDRLGVVFYHLGRYAEARRCQEEGLALRKAMGDWQGIATSLNNLGSLAYALGDHPQAKRLCEESLTLQRQLGDSSGIVISLQNLAYIALLLGEKSDAERHLEEALAVAQENGSGMLIARSLYNLGNVANALGEFARARCYFEQALATAVKSGTTSVALEVLVGLSVLLRRQGDKERALELIASVPHHPAAETGHRDAAERLLLELKSELPPAAVGAVLKRGRLRRIEEVLDLL